ncbi:MAG TPA: substrate binding domain-containing protein, partial [Rhizobacter sp.]|nr:substrate binding domain-containing protein [Rhizobacter sp.]
EAQLGVKLVHRTTHRFQVTEVGRRVFTHAQAIANEAAAVSAAVSDVLAEPSGSLRVSTSPLAAELYLGAWLAEFAMQHPKISLSLETTNRFVDLIGEGIDLALRYAATPMQSEDIVARRIGEGRMVLVGAPVLFKGVGEPRDIGDLPSYPALGLGGVGAVRPWTFRADSGDELIYQPTPRLVSDSVPALREAALRGAGLVQLPSAACAQALRSGSLHAVLTARDSLPTPLYAMYPSRQGMTSALRTLVDFVEERFKGIT